MHAFIVFLVNAVIRKQVSLDGKHGIVTVGMARVFVRYMVGNYCFILLFNYVNHIAVTRACDMQPCLNAGTCIQDADVTKFTCTCFDRFTGDRCETTLPSTPIVNCTLISTSAKGNTTAAPLSCYILVTTNMTAPSALTYCGTLRTNVTRQKYRIAWPTNKYVYDMLVLIAAQVRCWIKTNKQIHAVRTMDWSVQYRASTSTIRLSTSGDIRHSRIYLCPLCRHVLCTATTTLLVRQSR
jgi:hypothetical protein